MYKAAMIKDQSDMPGIDKFAEIDEKVKRTDSKDRVYAVTIKTAASSIEKYDITDKNSILKSVEAINISPPPEPVNSIAKHYIKQAAIYHEIDVDFDYDESIINGFNSNIIKEADISTGQYYTYEDDSDYISKDEINKALSEMPKKAQESETIKSVIGAEDSKRLRMLHLSEKTASINISDSDSYIRFYEIINKNRGIKDDRIKIAGYKINPDSDDGKKLIGSILTKEYSFIPMQEKLSAIKGLGETENITTSRMFKNEYGPNFKLGIAERIKLAKTDELKNALRELVKFSDKIATVVALSTLEAIDKKANFIGSVIPPIETIYGGTIEEKQYDENVVKVASDNNESRDKIEGLI